MLNDLSLFYSAFQYLEVIYMLYKALDAINSVLNVILGAGAWQMWEMSCHVNTDRGRCQVEVFITAKLGTGPQDRMKAQSLAAIRPIKIDFPVLLFSVLMWYYIF